MTDVIELATARDRLHAVAQAAKTSSGVLNRGIPVETAALESLAIISEAVTTIGAKLDAIEKAQAAQGAAIIQLANGLVALASLLQSKEANGHDR